MKKKNINLKGFTLIELLAVIVILAVIALIAVPQVLKILNKSRLSAAEDSVYGIVKSAETYVSNFMLKNSGTYPSEDLVFSCSSDGCLLQNTSSLSSYELDGLEKLEFKGTKPKNGIVTIKENGSFITLTHTNINGFNCKYSNGKAECSKEDLPTYIKVVYLNPKNLNEECNASNSVSTTGIKEGCMKWYAYAEDSTTYTMILDHNTTANIAWITKEDYIAAGGTEADYGTYGKNDKGPITVNKQLGIDITGWDSSLTPRLITAQEIASIVENESWTPLASGSGFFYFDSKDDWKNQTASSQGESEYAWLYDNTHDCTSYGCNTSDSGIYGYWTSTIVASHPNAAWRIGHIGILDGGGVPSNIYGVRPVITVEKSKIS